MGGDYTRFTFNPVKEFSGVRNQQGRINLDADFNEFEAILDRRRRAQMHDTVGSVGRAVVPMTTPNAFKIGLSGTQLTIGAGRAYVDGILAECFGDMGPNQPIDQDDVLGGIRGAGPLSYDKQPFFYTPRFPGLITTPNTINTVYLDVWQREVTVFEDDALREPALNGPDTATRVQTAWQVKVMGPALYHGARGDEEPSANCASTPAGWATLVAPSTARLTAKADGVLAPPPGPCEINPAGGYTGLENRLYRVEVHVAGNISGTAGSGPFWQLRPAYFKWSRDNASLAARVVAVAQSGTKWTIKVSSTGPDAWTRFDQGDHIELLDDDFEFAMRETGRGGPMMKVISVDHANEVLVVDANLSAFTVRPERHPRIRRWDSASATEPTFRKAVAGVAVPLELGISITFEGVAQDTLHAGDYWVFEARTADGSIGRLVNAPPRGPLHHFAKLGYVTVGQSPTDCRVFWPPAFGGGTGESCCTKVVKPGEDIQAAIGALGGQGGCVCLKMGIHTITQPLVINQSNITLHAEAPLVTVRLDASGPLMLWVLGGRNVSVLGIRFEARDGAKGGAAMITLDGVRGGRVADCSLGFTDGAPAAANTIGIRMDNCDDYAIEDNALALFETGIKGTGTKGEERGRVRIIGNALTGPSSTQIGGQWSAGDTGITFTDTYGVDVERNLVSDYRRGIAIGELDPAATMPALDLGHLPGCRIAANVVARRGGAPISFDTLVSSAPVKAISFAIAARMPRCEIVENAIRLDVNGDGGILADCGNVLIARNLLSSTAGFATGASAYILPRGVVALVRESDAFACVVRDNLFTGVQQAVFAGGTGKSTGAVRRVDIVSNHIAGSPEMSKAIVAAFGGAGSSGLLPLVNLLASIFVWQVRLGRVAGNEISTAICAVLCDESAGVVVQGNSISNSIAGILSRVARECEIADNLIDKAIVGVWTFGAQQSVLRRNGFTRTDYAIIDLMGSGVRVEDNDVSGGVRGIDLFATADGEVRGNTVQDVSDTGIGALPVNTVTLSHNKTIRCGYRASAAKTDLATGISVFALDAQVLIESCQALDIGVSSDTNHANFQGGRIGISVYALRGRARVHGCTITSPPMAMENANGASRALLISAGKPPKPTLAAGKGDRKREFKSVDGKASVDFADAADNLAEQTALPVVEIVANGEIIFSDNRCRLLSAEPVNGHVVRLEGTCLAVTGNRVRKQGGDLSLKLMAAHALTLVGNVMTTGADITGVPAVTPVNTTYEDFNART